MTDALAILAVVLLLVLSVWAWRKWGGPAVAVLWLGAGAVLAIFWRRERLPKRADPPRPTEAERQARASIAEQVRQGQQRIVDAQRAAEAAARLEADVDALDDAEALTAHLTARSRGER